MTQYSTLGQSNSFYSNFGYFQPLEETDYQNVINKSINDNINVSLAGELQPNIFSTGDYSLKLTKGGPVNPTAVDFANSTLLDKTQEWMGGIFGRQPAVIDAAYYGLFGEKASGWKYVPFVDSWSKVEQERRRVDEQFVANKQKEIDTLLSERYKEQAPLVVEALQRNLGVNWKETFAKGANNKNAYAEQVYRFLLDETRKTTNKNALYSSLLNLKSNDKPIWNWTYANILSDYDVLASTALTLGVESLLTGSAVTLSAAASSATASAARATGIRLGATQGSEGVIRLAQTIGKTTGSPNWWSLFKSDYTLSTRLPAATRNAQRVLTQALESGKITQDQIKVLQRLRPDLFTTAATGETIIANPFSIATNARKYLQFRGLEIAGTGQQVAINSVNRSKLVDALSKVALTTDDILLVGKSSSHLNYLFKVGKSGAVQGALDGAANAVFMGKERADQMLMAENIDIPSYNLSEVISSAALFGAFGFTLGIGFGAITSPVRTGLSALTAIDGRASLGTPNAKRGLLQYVGPDRMTESEFNLRNALASVVGKQAALAAEVNANSRVAIVRDIVKLLTGSEEIGVRLVDPRFLEANNLTIEEVSGLITFITQELIGKSSKSSQIGSIPAGLMDDIIAAYAQWKRANPTAAVNAFEIKAVAGEDFLKRLTEHGVNTNNSGKPSVLKTQTIDEINQEVSFLETVEAVEKLGASVVDGKIKVLKRRKQILEAKELRRKELPDLKKQLEELNTKDKTPEVEADIKKLEEKIKRYERQAGEPLKDNNPNAVIIRSSSTSVRTLQINGFDISTSRSGLLLSMWLDTVNKIHALAGQNTAEARKAVNQLRQEAKELEEQIDSLYRKPEEKSREEIRKNWFDEQFATIKNDPTKLAQFRQALGAALSQSSATTGSRAVSMNWLSQLRFESGLGELYTRLASYGTGTADLMYSVSDVLFHTMEMLDSSQLFSYASLADMGSSLSVKEAVDRGYRLAMGVNSITEQLRRMDPRKAALIEQRVVRDIREGATQLSDTVGLNEAEINLANDLITNTRKFFTFFGDQAKKLGKDFEDSFTYVPQMLTRKLDSTQQAKLAQLGYEAAVRKIMKEGSIPWSELERLGQIERGTDGSIINIPETSLFYKTDDAGKALPLSEMVAQMPKTMDELRLLEAQRRKLNNELAELPEDLRQILEAPNTARVNKEKLKRALDEQKNRVKKLFDRAVGVNGGFNIFDINALAKSLYTMKKYATELGELDYVAYADDLLKKLDDNGLAINEKPTSPRDHIINGQDDLIKAGSKIEDLELKVVDTFAPEITLTRTAPDGTKTVEKLSEGFVVKQWVDKTKAPGLDFENPAMSLQTVLLNRAGSVAEKQAAANAGFQYTISNIVSRLEDMTGTSAGDSVRIGFNIEDLRTGFITEEHIFNWMRSEKFKSELNQIRQLTKNTGLNDVELGLLLINKYVGEAKEYQLKSIKQLAEQRATTLLENSPYAKSLQLEKTRINKELLQIEEAIKLTPSADEQKLTNLTKQKIKLLVEKENLSKELKEMEQAISLKVSSQIERTLANVSEDINTLFLKSRRAGKPLDNLDTLTVFDKRLNKVLADALNIENPNFVSWKPVDSEALSSQVKTRVVTDLEQTTKLYQQKTNLVLERIKLQKEISNTTPPSLIDAIEKAYKATGVDDIEKAVKTFAKNNDRISKLVKTIKQKKKQLSALADDTSEEAGVLTNDIAKLEETLEKSLNKVRKTVMSERAKVATEVKKKAIKQLEKDKAKAQERLTKVEEAIGDLSNQIKALDKKSEVSVYGTLFNKLSGEEQEALLEYIKLTKGTAVGLESLVFTEQLGKELENLFEFGGPEALAKWGISPENFVDNKLSAAGRLEYLQYLAKEMPGEKGAELKASRAKFIEESTSMEKPKINLETDPKAVIERAKLRNKAIQEARELENKIVQSIEDLDADYELAAALDKVKEALELASTNTALTEAVKVSISTELDNARAVIQILSDLDPRFETALGYVKKQLDSIDFTNASKTGDLLVKVNKAIQALSVEDYPIKEALRTFQSSELKRLQEEYGVNIANYIETADKISDLQDSLYNELANIELGPEALINPADPNSMTYRQLFDMLYNLKHNQSNARKAIRDHLGSLPFDTADKADKLKALFTKLDELEAVEQGLIKANLEGHSLKFGEAISNWVDETRTAFDIFKTGVNKTESTRFFNLMKEGLNTGYLISRVRGEDGKYLYRVLDLYHLTDQRYGSIVPTEVHADFDKIVSIIQVRKQTRSNLTFDKVLQRKKKLLSENEAIYGPTFEYLESFKTIVDGASVFDINYGAFFNGPELIRKEVESLRKTIQDSLEVVNTGRKEVIAAINDIQKAGRSEAKVANLSPELRSLMAEALKRQREYQETISKLLKEGFVGTNPQQAKALQSVFDRIQKLSKLSIELYEGKIPTSYEVQKAVAKAPELRAFKNRATANRRRLLKKELEENADILDSEINTANEVKELNRLSKLSKNIKREMRRVENGESSELFIKTPEGYVIPDPNLTMDRLVTLLNLSDTRPEYAVIRETANDFLRHVIYKRLVKQNKLAGREVNFRYADAIGRDVDQIEDIVGTVFASFLDFERKIAVNEPILISAGLSVKTKDLLENAQRLFDTYKASKDRAEQQELLRQIYKIEGDLDTVLLQRKLKRDDTGKVIRKKDGTPVIETSFVKYEPVDKKIKTNYLVSAAIKKYVAQSFKKNTNVERYEKALSEGLVENNVGLRSSNGDYIDPTRAEEQFEINQLLSMFAFDRDSFNQYLLRTGKLNTLGVMPNNLTNIGVIQRGYSFFIEELLRVTSLDVPEVTIGNKKYQILTKPEERTLLGRREVSRLNTNEFLRYMVDRMALEYRTLAKDSTVPSIIGNLSLEYSDKQLKEIFSRELIKEYLRVVRKDIRKVVGDTFIDLDEVPAGRLLNRLEEERRSILKNFSDEVRKNSSSKDWVDVTKPRLEAAKNKKLDALDAQIASAEKKIGRLPALIRTLEEELFEESLRPTIKNYKTIPIDRDITGVVTKTNRGGAKSTRSLTDLIGKYLNGTYSESIFVRDIQFAARQSDLLRAFNNYVKRNYDIDTFEEYVIKKAKDSTDEYADGLTKGIELRQEAPYAIEKIDEAEQVMLGIISENFKGQAEKVYLGLAETDKDTALLFLTTELAELQKNLTKMGASQEKLEKVTKVQIKALSELLTQYSDSPLAAKAEYNAFPLLNELRKVSNEAVTNVSEGSPAYLIASKLSIEDVNAYKRVAGSLLLNENVKDASKILPEQSIINILNDLESFGFIQRLSTSPFKTIEDLVAQNGSVASMFELTTQSLNNSLNKVLDFSPESLILGNAVRSSTAQHRIMGTLRSATLKKKLASVAPDSDEARRITDEINNFLSSVEKTEAEEIFQAMDRLFLLQRMQKNIGKLKPEDVVSVEASAGVSKEDIIAFLKRKEAENVLEIDALSAKISTYKANNSTKIIPKVMEKEVGKLSDVSVEPWKNGKLVSVADQIMDALKGNTKHYTGKHAGATKTGLQEDMEAWAAGMNGEPYTPTTSGTVPILESARAKSYDGSGKPYFNNDDLVDPQNAELASYLSNDLGAITQKYAKTAGASLSADVALRDKIKQKYGIDLPKNFGWSDWMDVLRDYVEGLKRNPLVDFEGRAIKMSDKEINHLKEVIDGMSRIRREFTGEVDSTELPPHGIRQAAKMGKNALLSTVGPFMGTAVLLTELPFSLFRKNGSLKSFLKGLEVLSTGSSRRRLEHTAFAFEKLNRGFHSKFGGEELINNEITWFNRLKENFRNMFSPDERMLRESGAGRLWDHLDNFLQHKAALSMELGGLPHFVERVLAVALEKEKTNIFGLRSKIKNALSLMNTPEFRAVAEQAARGDKKAQAEIVKRFTGIARESGVPIETLSYIRMAKIDTPEEMDRIIRIMEVGSDSNGSFDGNVAISKLYKQSNSRVAKNIEMPMFEESAAKLAYFLELSAREASPEPFGLGKITYKFEKNSLGAQLLFLGSYPLAAFNTYSIRNGTSKTAAAMIALSLGVFGFEIFAKRMRDTMRGKRSMESNYDEYRVSPLAYFLRDASYAQLGGHLDAALGPMFVMAGKSMAPPGTSKDFKYQAPEFGVMPQAAYVNDLARQTYQAVNGVVTKGDGKEAIDLAGRVAIDMSVGKGVVDTAGMMFNLMEATKAAAINQQLHQYGPVHTPTEEAFHDYLMQGLISHYVYGSTDIPEFKMPPEPMVKQPKPTIKPVKVGSQFRKLNIVDQLKGSTGVSSALAESLE